MAVITINHKNGYHSATVQEIDLKQKLLSASMFGSIFNCNMLSVILVVTITKYYRNVYQDGQNMKADQNWPITVPFIQTTM